jgi:hypothetical protein
MPFNFRRKPSPLLAPKVMVIDFRPAAIPIEWNHSDTLIQQFVATMRQASGNTLIYQVVKKIMSPKYPILLDGRQYDDTTWTQALNDDRTAFRDAHGNYMMADYQRIMQDFDIVQQIKNKLVDEVWMFGGPYFGFFESRMVGQGAFWCNAPGIEQNSRRFMMMGYNYQREVREMVHDFGHRVESILAKQFDSTPFIQQLYWPQPSGAVAMPQPKNDFEQFLQVHGTVHRKPGGADYEQDEIAWVTALKPAWFTLAVDLSKVKTA